MKKVLPNGSGKGQKGPLRGLELGRRWSWTGKQVGHIRKGLKCPAQELRGTGEP